MPIKFNLANKQMWNNLLILGVSVHTDTLTTIDVIIDKCEFPAFYWLPKLHKNPYL